MAKIKAAFDWFMGLGKNQKFAVAFVAIALVFAVLHALHVPGFF